MPAPLQNWEKEYQPWLNLVKAMVGVAPQAVTLAMCWWSVSEWNSRSYEVVSYCEAQDTKGYVCEATKAFARCFPFVGTSTTLVVAGRFMLQRWFYYRMLLIGGLLDYDNYVIYTDPAFLLVAISFLCGLGHFVFTFYFDAPTKDQLARIFGDYIPACCIYFAVFERFCNIEKHLVTLPKFFEEDADWSKAHIHKSSCYDENVIRHTSRDARNAIETESAEGGYSLDQVLERTMKNSTLSHGTSFQTPRHKERTGLFSGLWPARLVLDPRLTDPASRIFQRVFFVFAVFFVIVHVGMLLVLGVRVVQGYHNAYPPDDHVPTGKLNIDGSTASFDLVGSGHCRGASLRRPNFHYIMWEDFNLDATIQGRDAPAQAELRGPADQSRPTITTIPQHEDYSRRVAWREGYAPPAQQMLRRERYSGPVVYHVKQKRGAHTSPGRQTLLIATDELNAPVGYLKEARDAVERTLQGCEDDADGHCLHCAKACASNEDCIGFAIDPEFCTNYLNHEVPPQPGWTARGQTGEQEHEVSRIVRVKGGDDDALFTDEAPTRCYAKLNSDPEPQDLAGVVVFLMHFGLILYIFHNSLESFWNPKK